MSIESKKFLNDLFAQLKNTDSEFRFLEYKSVDFRFPYVEDMADFLKDMHDVHYDRKKAIIHMSTKNGQVYSIDEINEFNQTNKEDLKIIGVGNEIGSLTHDPGCAIIKVQVNVETYQKEVKTLGFPDFKEKYVELTLEDILSRFKQKKQE